MSIVKNNTSTTDDNITIKALSEIGTYTLSEKTVLTSSGYKPNYLSNSGFYFMMRCEIPEGASGYLMGIKTSSTADVNNTFYIHYASGTITWKIGNSTYTKAREAGVHDIGWANGKPIYDNALVDNSATAQSGVHTSKMAICGVNTDGTFSFISSLTLYRVDMEVYEGVSPTVSSRKYLERFYLSASTLVNAMKIPEATMVCYNASGGAGTGSASGSPTYGVQLDDLRYLTRSGYRDLMAIVCQDNGAAAETWADGEDYIRNSGMTDVHNFAFRLADGTGANVNNPIKTPAGYSVSRPDNAYKDNFDWKYYIGSGSTSDPANYSGELPYEKGELIYGRKPNWSIWADGMKWGRYVEGHWAMKSDVNMAYQTVCFLRFNVFKDWKGQDLQELLKRWDGYNSAAYHIPAASVLGGLNLEFHNKVACVCNFSTELTGKNSAGTSASSADDKAIFKYSLESNTLAYVKIGNAAPWDIPRNQIDGQDVHWVVKGVAIEFVYENATKKYVIANASAYGSERVGETGADAQKVKTFALESDQDKTDFRDNGKEIGDAQFASALGEGLWGIYAIDKGGKATSVTQATLSTFCKMALLSGNPNVEVTETNKIYLDYILPRVGEQNIIAMNNPVSFHVGTATTTARFIAGELNGKVTVNDVKYDIQVYRYGTARSANVEYETELEWWTAAGVYSRNGMGIGFPFALAPENAASVSDLLDLSTSANECIAFIDYRAVSEYSGYHISVARYIHFGATESIYWQQNSYPRYGQPFVRDGATAQWSLSASYSGHVYPLNIAVSGSNEAKVRSALFRWKDLLRSGNSDYNNWHAPYSSGTTRYPATAHVRVFQKTNGPVAWDLDIRGQEPAYGTGFNGFNIDYMSGQQFVHMSAGPTAADYRFYFINGDRIMEKGRFAAPWTLAKIVATAWGRNYGVANFTRYEAKYGQSGNVAYAIPAFSVYVDEIPLHSSHDEGRMTTVAKFTNVQPGSSIDNNGYRLQMQGPYYNADYVILPNGTSNGDLATDGENGSGLTGFYHFILTTDTESKWHAGSLFVFRFGFGTLDEYTNAKYDGTTN